MANDLNRLSKFLAVMLRHKPDAFRLELDAQGYAPLEAVWVAICNQYGTLYSYDDLEQIVAGDGQGKKRYEICGDRIRALYGHSQPTIEYPAAEPPSVLYHGTTSDALVTIRQEGLTAQGRQYVHLTSNDDIAHTVARRRTPSPVILTIRAQVAAAAGVVFYHPEDQHYLARAIAAHHIIFP